MIPSPDDSVAILRVSLDGNPQAEIVWQTPGSRLAPYVEIRDEHWSATFGQFQLRLAELASPAVVTADFSQVEWIDPIPLLGILVTLKSFCISTGSNLRVQLGDGFAPNRRRQGFLKFIGQHGFLRTLEDLRGVAVTFNGDQLSLASDSPLWQQLASESFSLTYADSRCVTAKIISSTTMSPNADKGVSELIQPWLEELRNYGLRPYFEGEPELVDDMLHKARVLFTEIVHNAFDHAYLTSLETRPCLFGLYARVRRGGDLGQNAPLLQAALHSENTNCPTLDQFTRDTNVSWIEVFYFDAGRGFLADLERWKTCDDRLLRAKLAKIRPETNALHQISHHLFQQPISRYPRTNRTALTGLQHVRLVLSHGEDFARLYSNGEWVGAVHPWGLHASGGTRNLRKSDRYSGLHHALGTAWHYCLRLSQKDPNASDPAFRTWARITPLHVENDTPPATPYEDWAFFDERDLGAGVGYRDWGRENLAVQFGLWLPGAITKQHVYQWLNAVLASRSSVSSPTAVWLIADLTQQQAQTLLKILLTETRLLPHTPPIEVFVLTADWLLTSLSIPHKSRRLAPRPRSHSLQVASKRGGALFRLLRTRDSTLFWEGLEHPDPTRVGSAYLNEEVIWTRTADDQPDVILKGYLDLTQALVQPQRAAIAARALRRTWHMFAQGAECVAADVLLTNLLPREARLGLTKSEPATADGAKPRVVVSSILVTGHTAARAESEGRRAIHLLRHTQVLRNFAQTGESAIGSARFALNWLDPKRPALPCKPDELPYERIPGTPYIGRGGAKAIPVRRFERQERDGSFFAKPIYEETPQATYEHFLRLGLLKLGHWVYGAHHDLLTLNLGLTVDRESLDHGPLLTWFCTQLTKLRSHGAELVVYPSHSTTEKLVQALKRATTDNPVFAIPDHFIPVHFLGTHTQTAIRIPSLTYDRIRQFLQNPEYDGRRVVLLDDAAVTGKVQRELEQLLRNAGAEEVFHLGIVNRTGLPLYRHYLLGEHRHTHRYYWRWDMPPLGSARTCPLCRALEQARQLTRTLWSSQARGEISKWIESWTERPVSSHWWRYGETPVPLPETRDITFGKEWPRLPPIDPPLALTGPPPLPTPPNEEVSPSCAPLASHGASQAPKLETLTAPTLPNTRPKTIPHFLHHTTTTGLASTVAELIRITSYKEVGLRIARHPWPSACTTHNHPTWGRAQLEILIVQTLLFFDDFDARELSERFAQLSVALVTSSHLAPDYNLESLACLTLLLVPDAQVKSVASHMADQIASTSLGRSFPPHVLTTFGLLARRAHLSFNEYCSRLAAFPDNHGRLLAESQALAAFTLAQAEADRGSRYALMTLIMLLGSTSATAHTGFLQKRLTGELKGHPGDIARDLRFASQAFNDIDRLLLDGPSHPSVDPRNCAQEFDQLARRLDGAAEGPKAQGVLDDIEALLFRPPRSLAAAFRNTFLETTLRIAEYLRTSIGSLTWQAEVVRKANDQRPPERWTTANGSLSLPQIVTKTTAGLNGREIAIFPPVARQMVHELLLNVYHSSKSYPQGEDMVCTLSVEEDCLAIEMRNIATSGSDVSHRKISEAIVSQQLLRDPIKRRFDRKLSEMVVTVRLPLIAHLGRSST